MAQHPPGPDRLWGQGADGGRSGLAAARNQRHSEARRSVQTSADVGWVGYGGIWWDMVGYGGMRGLGLADGWWWLEMVGTCWKAKIAKGISQRNTGLKRCNITVSCFELMGLTLYWLVSAFVLARFEHVWTLWTLEQSTPQFRDPLSLAVGDPYLPNLPIIVKAAELEASKATHSKEARDVLVLPACGSVEPCPARSKTWQSSWGNSKTKWHLKQVWERGRAAWVGCPSKIIEGRWVKAPILKWKQPAMIRHAFPCNEEKRERILRWQTRCYCWHQMFCGDIPILN